MENRQNAKYSAVISRNTFYFSDSDFETNYEANTVNFFLDLFAGMQ